jgi:hypothetical protein
LILAFAVAIFFLGRWKHRKAKAARKAKSVEEAKAAVTAGTENARRDIKAAQHKALLAILMSGPHGGEG